MHPICKYIYICWFSLFLETKIACTKCGCDLSFQRKSNNIIFRISLYTIGFMFIIRFLVHIYHI